MLTLCAASSLLCSSAGAGWQWLSPRTTTNSLTGISFVGNDTGYAAGVWGTVLRTCDAGSTWTLLPTTFSNDLMSLQFPVGTRVGYAGGNSGEVYRTADWGGTWTRLQVAGRPVEMVALCFPSDTLNGYAVGVDPDTIFRTTDGGQTWLHLPLPGLGFLKQLSFPVDFQAGYVVGGQGTILKTSDAGSSWQRLNAGTLYNLRAVCFPRSPDSGLVAGEDTFVLRTTDAGATWQRCPVPTRIGDFIDITVTPGSNTAFLIGYMGSIYRSTDFGLTWARAGQISERLDVIQFPTGPDTGYIAGGAGRIYRTTDTGQSWQMVTATPHTEHLLCVVFPTGPDTGYAAGFEGTILKTTDAGVAWTRQDLQTSSAVSGLAFPAGNDTGYACDAWGNLYLTWDGENWLSTGFAPYGLADISFPCGTQVGYACGSDGSFAKTTSGGLQWTYPSPPTNEDMMAVSFPPGQSDTGWVAGWSGLVYRTTDGGGTWSEESSGVGPLNGLLFPHDTRTGYALGDGIAKTTDGGATWSLKRPSSGLSVYRASFPFSNDTGYVSGGEMLYTTDGGESWTTQVTRCRNELPGVRFCGRTGTGYAVGAYGSILKATEGGQWIEEAGPPRGAGRREHLPTLLVCGVLPLEAAADFRPRVAVLLDAAGRQVAELRPGPNDVSRLSPGVYFVRQQSVASSQHSGRSAVTKVVIQ
ncbi:hypothetical protein FJY69_00045 [candidate division WOR-3 bacterium]|nr:hypothetical protein [candidate division WOR-3 bacterium]